MIVANARKIPTITESESKNDGRDAEQLARMAAFDPRLLSPLEHRSLARQQDLNLIQARAILVKARTMIVNALRGLVKSAGGRLPACSTESLPTRVMSQVIPPSPGHGGRSADRTDRPAQTRRSAPWTSRSKPWPPSILRSPCYAARRAWDRW